MASTVSTMEVSAQRGLRSLTPCLAASGYPSPAASGYPCPAASGYPCLAAGGSRVWEAELLPIATLFVP